MLSYEYKIDGLEAGSGRQAYPLHRWLWHRALAARGRTWLTTELRDILHNNRFVYCWSKVLEETEAREKLIPTEDQPRSGLKRYLNK